MKSFALHLLLILCFTSCITSTHMHYSDPNYLNSNEFSTYEEITKNYQIEQESFTTETTADSNSYYSTDDYYDYSFSSRIRRFHRPIYYSGYYGGIYTDYYWYNNDPFFCGTSIYYGYNWYSPYYSYYSYSPFYFDYYTPYYGNYHLYHAYGYNHYHHASHNTYNGNNYNAYITGPRGSLSSNSGGRKIHLNTNTTNTKRGQTTIKKNNTDRNYSTTNTNSNRGENFYSNTKRNSRKYNSNNRSNSRSYHSNNRSNRSNNSSQPSRRGGKSNMKPRR